MQVPSHISALDLTNEDSDSKSVQTYLTAIRMYYFRNYVDIEKRLEALMEEIRNEAKRTRLCSIFFTIELS